MTMTMQYNAPSEDIWCMTEEGFNPALIAHYESIFALTNGYMGMRASLETNPSLGDAGFFIAGVFDNVQGHIHEIVNLPIWVGIGMNVDGFPVDLRKGVLLEYKRTLDMKQGILFTHIVWRDAANHTTCFELATLVHQTEKHLGLQWGTITPLDYSANVGFESTLDAWTIKYGCPSKTPRLKDHKTAPLENKGISIAVSTKGTGLRIAMASIINATGAENRKCKASDDRISETMTVPVKEGEPLHFHKKAIAFTSRDGENPEGLAATELTRFENTSLQDLIASHVNAWTEVWNRTDIQIEGDTRAQKAIRFNCFHLAALANPSDDRLSIGAKGLHGNGYAGVYFWDTEIYMLPFYTHTNPASAKAFLKYRHHMLEDARKNAESMEQKGAFYPWNSSITGRGYHWPKWQEHVGSDVAYGIDWYVRATGDTEFLHNDGAEIIFETARYWQHRVEPSKERGYEITGLMGPDEIHRDIANNAFTNYLVKWHLNRAAELAVELEKAGLWTAMSAKLNLSTSDVKSWSTIAEKIYFPFDEERNIHEQFEGYFQLPEKMIDRSLSRMQYTGPVQHSFCPTKVAQQADTILMYWMFQKDFPEDVRKAGYKYYEPRCSHTSSLSRCIFAPIAAQTGLVEEAYRQFMLSAEADFSEGIEMESESGIHAACMGGTWLAAVTGFGGVWPRGDVLCLAPCLPAHWKGLAFPFAWQGNVLEIEVRPGAVRVRTRSGRTQVEVAGKRLTVDTAWTPWTPTLTADTDAGLSGHGVIFDLDGVLVDTAEYHYRAWQKLADRIGVPFDRKCNEALRGVDRMNSLLFLLGEHASRFSDAEKEAFCTEKNVDYVRLIKQITPADLLPGARELLCDLRATGALCAVGSSSRNARPVLESLGIMPLLNAVADGSEVATAKPAPDLFLLAAAKLGLDPALCVVVEDAEAGVAAAKAGSMPCIGIGDSKRVGAADKLVNSVSEITVTMISEIIRRPS
jgi:beta-phosphoglucomutase